MPISLNSSEIYSGLFSDPDLARLLGDASEIRSMIRFESALAKAQGQLGVIPADAANAIGQKLDSIEVSPSALAKGTASAGVPVPALVAELRNALGPDGTWLHWGATSQDVMDTATVLQVKACLAELETRVFNLINKLTAQSREHSMLVIAGRTRSQISTPITLGYRIAQWAHPLIEAENELPDLRAKILRLQFGGASGTGSALGSDWSRVSAELAKELGLQDSPSWHGNRSGLLLLGSWFLQITSALSKMAGDLILLGRSEIAEVGSGQGGGSSTMPQKANPVQAEAIQSLHLIAAASHSGLVNSAVPAEERDGARWALEWAFLPQMIIASGAALRHAQVLTQTIRPNRERMSATLKNHPEIMAEAASFLLAKNGVARKDAKDLVAAAVKSPLPFAEALAKLSPVALDWQTELAPQTAVAAARQMSDRIFANRRKSD